MNKTGNSDSFGSVLFGLIRTLLKPIMNQRGEAGENTPGDALEMEPTGANPLDQEPPTDPPAGDPPAVETPPAAEPLKTEPGEQPPGDPPAESPADTAFHKSERFQGMNKELTESKASLETMQSQIDEANKIAQFYQTQFNESQGLDANGQPITPGQPGQSGQPPGQQPGPPAPTMEPGQLPEGIVAPGDWEDQEQQGKWVSHTVKSEANTLMQEAYQKTVMPMMTQLSNAIASVQKHVARSGKEDFDDVITDVNKLLFNIGPDGKIYGVLNPGLLNYFKAQDNPYAAMYQHGLTAKAPQKIKEGVQKQTQKTLQKITKQPAGPTQPTGGDAPGETPDLDWDTPPAQSEVILNKKGLI